MAEIEKKRHHVYLFDYRLGERDGLELLLSAMALGISAPIILLTFSVTRQCLMIEGHPSTSAYTRKHAVWAMSIQAEHLLPSEG